MGTFRRVFDGIVTGRGFFDVRFDFTDSLVGEVRVEQLNLKRADRRGCGRV